MIVCDDGDLPETAATVARFPADRFFYRRNAAPIGPVRNWNECLRGARGRWVMILHEDDTLYPWYLATTLIPRLSSGTRRGLRCRWFPGPKSTCRAPRPQQRQPCGHYPPLYFIKSTITPFPGVLFPRELGLRLGGFDERTGPLADYKTSGTVSPAHGRIEGGAHGRRLLSGGRRPVDGPGVARDAASNSFCSACASPASKLRSRGWGRWLARFFTYRNALAYAGRLSGKAGLSLARALRFRRIPGSFLPSGWIWAALRLRASLSS